MKTAKMEARNNKMRILRFFLFNTELKCREGEEYKKIIYYWSRDIEAIDTQCRFIGLMEGVIRFGSVFSQTSLIKCLSTQKTRTVFFSPEPHITIVMTVSVPCKVVPSKKNLLEFRSENMDINTYRSVLTRSYNMFQFFNGPNISSDSKCISHFFQQLIPSINIPSSGIFDLLPSIRFLTLGSSSFLKVTTLVNKIENMLEQHIHSVTFIHEEKIVWSSLQQEHLILLYNYLKTSVLSRETKDSKTNLQNPFQGHCGSFIVGQSGIESNSSSIPFIQLESNEYQLLVYGALQSLVVLTIFPLDKNDLQNVLKELDSFLGPSLTTLSADLCDVFGKVEDQSLCADPDIFENRFLYYNASNRALKSTIIPHARDQPLHCKVMCDLFSDIQKISNSVRIGNEHFFLELDVKSSNNQWVVGRKSGDRLFFVTTDRNSNLIELSDNVEKIVNDEFKNICLLDK
ncbi:vacuolar fusion protein CCZ1 homolog [Lepeophtheirus salmonis]|uniref:vacuolar fusion protein CCZ1 homolog n=1 Tax=Lepeophtheirus salmonis TaxID=72036 RepID=UPI001AE78B27|nr:vacuolar fusion protein CCZ1 homolog [Lepeophtheirus salmonis]